MVRRFGGGETDMKQSDTKQSDMKQSNIGRSVVRLLAAASAAALLLSATVYAGTWSQVGPDGAWTVGGWEASYDANYPLKDYMDQAGLQYVDVIMGWNAKGEPVMERRLRQDYNYGLYNYFGLSDDLCKALYGESDQIGTGEMAVDGDSLLVLGQVALYQDNVGSDTYRQQRNALALVVRDYLNSYLLLAMIIGAVLGICVYNPAINLPSFTSFVFTDAKGNISYLFPTLFVTIACGAVSGFHALVSSGTASKQIKNEKNMLPVSFGAMLLESLLAITALIAVGALATSEGLPTGTPPQVFAKAIAMFLTALGMPDSISYTLITLSISAFALTSLDSVARVGRIAFQEFFTNDDIDPAKQSSLNKVLTNKYFSTILTLALCYALSRAGYASIWPLFGSANQLLSALALIACAVFLKKTHRQGVMLWGPMVIMLGVTFTALTLKIKDLVSALSNQFVFGNALQLVFAILLLILGVIVAFEGIRKLLAKDTEADKAASDKGVTA